MLWTRKQDEATHSPEPVFWAADRFSILLSITPGSWPWRQPQGHLLHSAFQLHGQQDTTPVFNCRRTDRGKHLLKTKTVGVVQAENNQKTPINFSKRERPAAPRLVLLNSTPDSNKNSPSAPTSLHPLRAKIQTPLSDNFTISKLL